MLFVILIPCELLVTIIPVAGFPVTVFPSMQTPSPIRFLIPALEPEDIVF